MASGVGWLLGRALAQEWEAGGGLVLLDEPLTDLGLRLKYIQLAFSLEVKLLTYSSRTCPLSVPVT